MRQREVVTCFLQRDRRILVLRRSGMVRTHRGKWAGVSGSIDRRSPLEQALVEIQEETGFEEDSVCLVRQGTPLDVPDPETNTRWRVHPFLFEVREPLAVRLDWEHTESRWIDPRELGKFDAVPRLKETWEHLCGT